jgi:hypothetical protein
MFSNVPRECTTSIFRVEEEVMQASSKQGNTTHCLLARRNSLKLKMKAAHSSETLINISHAI